MCFCGDVLGSLSLADVISFGFVGYTIFVTEAKVPTTDLPWDIHVGAVQRIPLHCWPQSISPKFASTCYREASNLLAQVTARLQVNAKDTGIF